MGRYVIVANVLPSDFAYLHTLIFYGSESVLEFVYNGLTTYNVLCKANNVWPSKLLNACSMRVDIVFLMAPRL